MVGAIEIINKWQNICKKNCVQENNIFFRECENCEIKKECKKLHELPLLDQVEISKIVKKIREVKQ